MLLFKVLDDSKACNSMCPCGQTRGMHMILGTNTNVQQLRMLTSSCKSLVFRCSIIPFSAGHHWCHWDRHQSQIKRCTNASHIPHKNGIVNVLALLLMKVASHLSSLYIEKCTEIRLVLSVMKVASHAWSRSLHLEEGKGIRLTGSIINELHHIYHDRHEILPQKSLFKLCCSSKKFRIVEPLWKHL